MSAFAPLDSQVEWQLLARQRSADDFLNAAVGRQYNAEGVRPDGVVRAKTWPVSMTSELVSAGKI